MTRISQPYLKLHNTFKRYFVIGMVVMTDAWEYEEY